MKDRVKTTFDVSSVWKQVTPDLQAELVEFWKRNRAISDPDKAGKRATQAVCVARDRNGELCGVSTAVLRVLPRLQQPLYYYRAFLARSVRGQGHVFPFYNACREVLQAYNAQLERPESLGMLLELESRHLVAPQFQNAIVEEVDAVFIGYSPRGLVLRVSYFEGAKLMKPEEVLKIVRGGTESEAA